MSFDGQADRGDPVARYAHQHDVVERRDDLVGQDGVDGQPRFGAWQPSAIAGPLAPAETWVGITEQSATRRPCTPFTRSRGSTTASASDPIRQVPAA